MGVWGDDHWKQSQHQTDSEELTLLPATLWYTVFLSLSFISRSMKVSLFGADLELVIREQDTRYSVVALAGQSLAFLRNSAPVKTVAKEQNKHDTVQSSNA